MTKTKSFLFWLLALLITISSAVYQRMTGPTYPLGGKFQIDENEIPYKFERSHSITSDCKVSIVVKDTSVTANLFWRRYKFDSEYNSIKMSGKDTLVAFLPKQPPAGKLEYYVQVVKNGEIINIPEQNDVVIRFKGDVPTWILIPHVLAMFLSMLFASRAAFEYFSKTPRLKFYTYWTIGILFVGGFILGPIMQYYAFGAFWTGFPFGYDLTDNKTLIAMIAWLIAMFMLKRSAKPIKWILVAAFIMFIVYLIPHSVLGSEHDYSKSEQTEQQIQK
jgi:hypothetical protein